MVGFLPQKLLVTLLRWSCTTSVFTQQKSGKEDFVLRLQRGN